MTEKLIIKKTEESWEKSQGSFLLDGSKWYQEAKEFSSNLSKEYEVEEFKVCGLIAALSPMKSWQENKKLTIDFLKGKRKGHFKSQINKCKIILDSKSPEEVELILNGLKTTAFFRNIYLPLDNERVTIDRHISKIYNKGELLRITPARYRTIESAFKRLSKKVNLPVTTIQGTVWLYSKSIYGINI